MNKKLCGRTGEGHFPVSGNDPLKYGNSQSLRLLYFLSFYDMIITQIMERYAYGSMDNRKVDLDFYYTRIKSLMEGGIENG